jgi:hypothetical protein
MKLNHIPSLPSQHHISIQSVLLQAKYLTILPLLLLLLRERESEKPKSLSISHPDLAYYHQKNFTSDLPYYFHLSSLFLKTRLIALKTFQDGLFPSKQVAIEANQGISTLDWVYWTVTTRSSALSWGCADRKDRVPDGGTSLLGLKTGRFSESV